MIWILLAEATNLRKQNQSPGGEVVIDLVSVAMHRPTEVLEGDTPRPRTASGRPLPPALLSCLPHIESGTPAAGYQTCQGTTLGPSHPRTFVLLPLPFVGPSVTFARQSLSSSITLGELPRPPVWSPHLATPHCIHQGHLLLGSALLPKPECELQEARPSLPHSQTPGTWSLALESRSIESQHPTGKWVREGRWLGLILH